MKKGNVKKSGRAPRRPRAQRGEEAMIDPAFAPVAAAFAKDRDVALGRMFSSSSVLNVRGKIFAMFVKGKFVAKLPRERVDGLVRAGTGAYFDPGHGRLMKEWVALSSARASWVALAKEAHSFVKARRSRKHPG
jgi:hypothetical protein